MQHVQSKGRLKYPTNNIFVYFLHNVMLKRHIELAQVKYNPYISCSGVLHC